ncbi:hypothetical protein [Pleurocapsa sp. FMAR1]|uniref:hypothetical protein n=1 Tax=Pleurocapsa sp. FMAR1 TaxID=3040204 RepID=UPI0029C699E2|nr:hypothetical protein [Pleurocapsa sp. FMAR1]
MDSPDTPQCSQFNDHLLTARLKRVSQKNLENFYKDAVNKDSEPKNKAKLVEEIVVHYKIMLNNSEFQEKLGVFIRDYVLSARESEYLIEINDKQAFIKWVANWSNNAYVGNNFNFYKHIYFELPEQHLCLNKLDALKTTIQSENKKEDYSCLSFPNKVFLLVAYRKEKN